MVLLSDRRDGARDTNAVRAHRDPDRLAVRTERIETEGVGELAPELEDVPDLDPAREPQLTTAPRAPVPVTDFDRADLAVRVKVTTPDDVRRMLSFCVRAGPPGPSSHDQRVDEIAHTELTQQLRADVAPYQPLVFRQVFAIGFCAPTKVAPPPPR